MACMSRAKDVTRAASNQSCNGRDGEKLERKRGMLILARWNWTSYNTFMQDMMHRLDDVALTTT